MNRTSFFEEVYQVVRCIPVGRVSTYGAIAAYLGARRSARMVGWALNQAVNDIDIPAHRVVNRNGLLTGKYHFSTPTEMAEKLMAEGVMVENDRVVFFEKVFWNPSIALTL